MHYYQDLISLFNHCFEDEYKTKLAKGNEEPLYLPADENQPIHVIYFANGFFSSALHECSHWLIAGEQRRKLIDFGYWYVPDGRNSVQQKQFQHVEVKPQALEWILSVAAHYRFQISNDNLKGIDSDDEGFKDAIYQQVVSYCRNGLSERASLFRNALCRFYGRSAALSLADFDKILLA